MARRSVWRAIPRRSYCRSAPEEGRARWKIVLFSILIASLTFVVLEVLSTIGLAIAERSNFDRPIELSPVQRASLRMCASGTLACFPDEDYRTFRTTFEMPDDLLTPHRTTDQEITSSRTSPLR